jgi:Bacterial Ig domain
MKRFLQWSSILVTCLVLALFFGRNDKPVTQARSFIGPSATSPKYIGIPLSADVRGRMQITSHSDVDIVFTSPTTSTLTEFGTEFISNANYSTHPNSNYPQGADCNGTTNNEDGASAGDPQFCPGAYSSGHGGTIQLDIYADDNTVGHNPTGPSLGSHTWVHPMAGSATATSPNGRGFFTQAGNDQGSWQGGLAINPTPALTAGTRYHAVYTNPDPAGATNWTGINTQQQRGGRLRAASMDVIDRNDFDIRFRGRSNVNNIHDTANVWRSCSKSVTYGGGSGSDCWGTGNPPELITAIPIFYAKFANGESTGNGYELNVSGYANPASPYFAAWGPETNGTSSSRQTITVPSATQVTEIGAHIIPVWGSGSGVAVLNLRRTSDDALIVGASIPYAEPALLSDPGQGENGLNITATVPSTAVAAGQYYIEFGRTSGRYFPLILLPHTILSQTHFSNTGLFTSAGLPDWPAGSRYVGGEIQFRTSPTGGWFAGPSDADAMAYIRTSSIVTPAVLAPLTATITSPANGATGVASSSNATAATTSDPACTVTPVTFWIDGVQANIKTTSPWFTFPFDAAANPPFKTSQSISAGTHSIYAVAQDSCGRSTTSPTVTFTFASTIVTPVVTLTSPPTSGCFTSPVTIDGTVSTGVPPNLLQIDGVFSYILTPTPLSRVLTVGSHTVMVGRDYGPGGIQVAWSAPRTFTVGAPCVVVTTTIDQRVTKTCRPTRRFGVNLPCLRPPRTTRPR